MSLKSRTSTRVWWEDSAWASSSALVRAVAAHAPVVEGRVGEPGGAGAAGAQVTLAQGNSTQVVRADGEGRFKLRAFDGRGRFRFLVFGSRGRRLE